MSSSFLEELWNIISKQEYTSVDLENLSKYSESILNFYKKKNIPIDTIREMLNWTYIHQPEIKRVVIIDQVDFLEDYKLDNDYDLIISQRMLINLGEWELQSKVLKDFINEAIF